MAVLELVGISKRFGAIHALSDVSLQLEAGETIGLMGDNGAGKSTLVKIIAGNFPPSHGKMLIGGAEVVFHRPVEARQHGIEIVHQDLALCDNLSAGVNVFLCRELRRGMGLFRVLDYAAMHRRAGQLFAELKSETRPRDLVRQMSGGQRQAVAIARTRLSDAKVVLMDEPSAAISVLSIARSAGMVASNNKMVYQFGPDQEQLLWLGGGSTFGIANPVIALAVLTAIAGVLEAGWLGGVTTNLGQSMELSVIAATVIGGANLMGGSGTALGAVVGAALIEVIRNSLTLLGISTFWQGTFVGSFIVIAVMLDRLKGARQSE